MNYVGIDHHRQCSHMTLMDQEGRVLRSGRVPKKDRRYREGRGEVERPKRKNKKEKVQYPLFSASMLITAFVACASTRIHASQIK
jgi:hypothetical protein